MADNLQLQIDPKSKLHARVLQMVLDRKRVSERKMGEKYSEWMKAEKLYAAYVPKDEADRLRESKREQGSQNYVTINVPYSYAMLLSAHTYWSSIFLTRDPVFQYSARHGGAMQQVQAIEALVDYNVLVGGFMVPLYNWLLDTGKYGLGVICNYWCEEKTNVSQLVDVPEIFGGVETGRTKRKIQRTLARSYAGNKIMNVRPYDWLPDPRVPLVNFQQGEFCGRLTQLSYNQILRREKDGYAFNLDELRKIERSSADTREQGSAAVTRPDAPGAGDGMSITGDRGIYDIIEMHIELVPKDAGLSESDYPEKWVFTVANGTIVIGAQPAGDDHGKFPYSIQMYEMDAHSFNSRGMLEVLKGLNDTMSWLFNSHFFAVRKSLNGNVVVDPSRVVMKDLLEADAGRLIRLSPRAYGTDPAAAIKELISQDPTAQHFRDMKVVEEIMQRTTGVVDNIQGMTNAGGRKTATEVRTSSSFGINRLKTFCEYNSALGWSQLSQMLVQNLQQHYDEEQMLKIAGDILTGVQYIKVSPEDIMGFFDYVPVDGTMPIDRFAQANLWKEILIGMQNMPMLAPSYDQRGIFEWMATLGGLKNIRQFRVQVQPDAMLMQQAAEGKQVPVGAVAPEAIAQRSLLPSGQGSSGGNGVGPVQ